MKLSRLRTLAELFAHFAQRQRVPLELVPIPSRKGDLPFQFDIAMGVKAGMDPKVMLDIINAGSGRNSATQDKFPRAILPRTFDFGFATGLSYKDVRLCVEEEQTFEVARRNAL